MVRIAGKFLIGVWAAALIGLWSATALAAGKVAIRAGEHPTYGRLVMDWGKKQTVDAKIEDGHLIVRFPEAFEADIGVASRILDGYLGAGKFIEQNKAVQFPLKGNFTLKTARYGTAIAFDLSPKGKEAKVAASKVNVRSGEHADYSRLVFDWPSKTGYRLKTDEGQVVLTFDKIGTLQLDRIRRDPPKFVKNIKTAVRDGKTEVTVTTEPAVSAKAFLSGNSVVVDIKPGTIKKDVRTAEQAKPVKPVKKVSKPVRKITPPKPVRDIVVSQGETAGPTQEVAEKQVTETASSKPLSLIPVEDKPAVAAREVAPPPTETLTVEVGKLKDGVRLIFPWKSPAAMALFERSGKYWLTFDKRVKLDFKKLVGPVKFLVIRKKQISHDTATVAALTVREGYAPTVTRTVNEWRIDFRLGEAPVIENTIDIQPQPAFTNGARVFIPAVKNGDRVSFIDPQAGDELISVPLHTPSWGIGRTRTFAQFTVLPSMQGIGLMARDTSVQVAVERNGVSITAAGGLQLTRTISKDDLFASGDQTDRFSGKKDKALLVKLDEWAQVPPKDFWEKKQVLQKRVAKLPRAGRNGARMELAKFLLAHRYHADAFAVLERVRLDDPRADDDGIYRLVRGLSKLGLNHLEEAKQDLFNPVFAGVTEVAPWRAKVAAGLGDWKTASVEIKNGRDAFGVYSGELQNEFRLLEAEAALEDFDIEVAQKAIEGIKTSLTDGTDPKVAATREYFEGLAALKSGDMDRAISKFDQAIALDYRPVEAQARYAKTNAQLALKDITPEEAIDQLHKMEFAWRGDDLEVDIQKRIGDLHIAIGEMREGLQTYRQIVKSFAKNPKARDIAREMADIFNQLFLEGGAEKLPPVKALALYYEYRELTPLGKKGDRMIRKLADRLIKVDLLDQAAQLLDHQVNFRLKGEQKSYTGTKLAVVHLWNEKPQESLNIIQKTRWRALPASVKQERLHIRARAHSDLENYDEALELLLDDKSEKADLLRADIYWESKNWAKVIQSLEKLMKDSGAEAAKKLEPIDRQRLMQLAVARSLSNDQAGIASMRSKYRKKLVGTPDIDAFDLITEDPDGSETEFRKRSTAIAKIAQLESFMAGYRERLKNGQFWATN